MATLMYDWIMVFFCFHFQVNVIGIHWYAIVVGVVKTTDKMRSCRMSNHFKSEVMFRFCLVYLILASASCQAGEHNHPCRFNPECLCSTGGEVFILTSYKDWRRCYWCSIFIWESALYLPITMALETKYLFCHHSLLIKKATFFCWGRGPGRGLGH